MNEVITQFFWQESLHYRRSTRKRGLLFGLALTFGLTGISVAAAPAEDGASLLETRCSVCHPAAKPKAAKKTPDQWESTVSRMISKGAQLTAGEKKILVDYLGKTYKH